MSLNHSVATNTTHFTIITHRYSVEMAQLGSFRAKILMAIMVVGLFCVTNIVAKNSEIAPTAQLEAGAGFALTVSRVVLCSSVLASLVAVMMQ